MLGFIDEFIHLSIHLFIDVKSQICNARAPGRNIVFFLHYALQHVWWWLELRFVLLFPFQEVAAKTGAY